MVMPVMSTGQPQAGSQRLCPAPSLPSLLQNSQSSVPAVPGSSRPLGDARSAKCNGQFCLLSNTDRTTMLPEALPSSLLALPTACARWLGPSCPVVAPTLSPSR